MVGKLELERLRMLAMFVGDGRSWGSYVEVDRELGAKRGYAETQIHYGRMDYVVQRLLGREIGKTRSKAEDKMAVRAARRSQKL